MGRDARLKAAGVCRFLSTYSVPFRAFTERSGTSRGHFKVITRANTSSAECCSEHFTHNSLILLTALWGGHYDCYCSVDVKLTLKEVKELAWYHTAT